MPAVTDFYPDHEATGIAVTSAVIAVFNSQMDPTTITEYTFLVVKDDDYFTPVVGEVSYAEVANAATFTPATSLSQYTRYRALLHGQTDPDEEDGFITALDGTPLPGDVQWTFTTGTGVVPEDLPDDVPDSLIYASAVPPTASTVDDVGYLAVTETSPANYDYNVASGTPILIYLNDGMEWEEEWSAAAGLPSGAFIGPSGWLRSAITVEAYPALDLPGQTRSTPTFEYSYDEDEDLITLAVGSGQYSENTDFVVTIESTKMKGHSTGFMLEDYQFFFSSTFNPLYASVALIRMVLGDYINNVPDNSILKFIYWNSLTAEDLAGTNWRGGTIPRYVLDYVVCKTALDLINAQLFGAGGLGGGTKKLGDLSIQRGSQKNDEGLMKLRDEIYQCVRTNEGIIKAGGDDSLTGYTIKSQFAARFPGWDDTWHRLNGLDKGGTELVKPQTIVRSGSNSSHPFIRRRKF